MGDVISVRMDEKIQGLVDKFLQERGLERSEGIRSLLVTGIYFQAIQGYVDGRYSVQKAASLAGMALWEFMDLLARLGIGSNLDLADVVEGYEALVAANKEPTL